MHPRLTRALAITGLTLTLGACATAAPDRSGFLSGYEGLQPREKSGRAKIRQFRDPAALEAVRRVTLTPAVLSDGADSRSPLTPEERHAVLREVARTSIDASFANADVKASMREALARW